MFYLVELLPPTHQLFSIINSLISELNLLSCPSLRTPPLEVVGRGFESVKAYLKRLHGGFTECRRTKLMFVGLGEAGKTRWDCYYISHNMNYLRNIFVILQLYNRALWLSSQDNYTSMQIVQFKIVQIEIQTRFSAVIPSLLFWKE